MEALGIDGKLLLAQLINIAILYALFQKFLVPHLKAFIERKKLEEEKTHKLIKELEEKQATLTKEEQSLRAQLKKERDEMLKLAAKEAQRLKEELAAKAQKETEYLISKSKDALALQEKQFHEELKKDFVDALSKVLTTAFKDKLTPAMQKEIIEHIAQKKLYEKTN